MNITNRQVRVNWGGSYFDKGDVLLGAPEDASVYGSNGDGADRDGQYWAFRYDGMLVCIGDSSGFEVLD